MLERHLTSVIASSISGFRATILNGPRQSGKTTLLRQITANGGAYVSFDDESVRAQALADPHGFVASLNPPGAIDEVQRVGEPIVLAIKAAVDQRNETGRFLLAGSTRFLTVPQISESLAGRAEILDLWPLSQGELHGRAENFVDTVFASPNVFSGADVSQISRYELLAAIHQGGFPETIGRDHSYVRRWFRTYLRTVIERDIVMTFRDSCGYWPRIRRENLCLRGSLETHDSATNSCGVTWDFSNLSGLHCRYPHGCPALQRERNGMQS
jgi:uncharacterized protein